VCGTVSGSSIVLRAAPLQLGLAAQTSLGSFECPPPPLTLTVWSTVRAATPAPPAEAAAWLAPLRAGESTSPAAAAPALPRLHLRRR
jgi:hypothetical protein